MPRQGLFAACGVLVAVGLVVGLGLLGKVATSPAVGSADAASTVLGGSNAGLARTSDMLSRLSALRELPALAAAELDTVAPRFEQLSDGNARVDLRSVRRSLNGVYLGRRSDNLPCISTTRYSVCFSAFLEGGIALAASQVRVSENSDQWQGNIEGVVADNISSVKFVLRDGRTLDALVRNNTVALDLPGRSLTEVTGYEVDGTQVAWAPMPEVARDRLTRVTK